MRSTLYLGRPGVSVLRWHAEEADRSAADPLRTPPSLPLLVLLSLAAQNMHTGGGLSASNYYGRLFGLLDVADSDRSRLRGSYMDYAERIWGTLNRWLEAWEGERGIPTTYAIGMRYVGLPMSQALMRRRDREALPQVFWDEGLPPGLRMASPEMEALLQPHLTGAPSPFSASLRALWPSHVARERIVQVACLELEAWPGLTDGEGVSGGPPRVGAMRLIALLRTMFSLRLQLGLSVPQVNGAPAAVHLQTIDGNVTLSTRSAPLGTARVADSDQLDGRSLLTDQLAGILDGSTVRVQRRPRRVLPLRMDEIQGCYVEVERLAGDDSIVLAVQDAEARLDAFLEQVARPGWSRLDSVPGLPPGVAAVPAGSGDEAARGLAAR